MKIIKILEAVSKIKNSFLFFRTLLSASVKTPKTYRFRRFLLLIGRNLKNLKFKKFGFLRLLLPIFFMLVFLTSCSNLDVQLLNQKAMDYMKQGDVDSAIARLESINDLNPNFPETNYNLGIAYHKKQEYQKALSSLDKATTIKPDFAQAYYTKGVIYEEMALNLIDSKKSQDENNNKNEQDKQKMVEYLTKSKENFENYMHYSPKAQDTNEVNSKIEQLNNDIKHYSGENS